MDPALETRRLLLRPLRRADVHAPQVPLVERHVRKPGADSERVHPMVGGYDRPGRP